MSEVVKTVVYVVVAASLATGAYLSRPEPVGVTISEELDKPLFSDFKDPLQAKSLSITAYDEKKNELQALEIAFKDNTWVIRSKGGYPADAQEQMTKAANALIGLNVLSVKGDLKSLHQEYGVVEPTEDAVNENEAGLGKLVTIKGDSNVTLASLIIGKGDEDNPSIRYVRVSGRDRIYAVTLDPAIYTADFSDWLEKDLLRINPFDVKIIEFKDYLLQPQPAANGELIYSYLPRMDATVAYDERTSKWILGALLEPSMGQMVPAKLAANESLDTEKLDDVRNGLDELLIVNAVRKPAGLAENLKLTGNFSPEDLQTLHENGFFPVQLPGQQEISLNGNNGELIVETRDFIRYRLLFGKEQPTGDEAGSLNRFLFVKAELNQSQLVKPVLVEVPELKEGDNVDIEALAKVRDEIILENDRNQDAYQEQRNATMRKIYELNSRFADWYYVISDEQFKKIFLKRNQLIAKPAGLFEQGFPSRPPVSVLNNNTPAPTAPVTPQTAPPAPGKKESTETSEPVEKTEPTPAEPMPMKEEPAKKQETSVDDIPTKSDEKEATPKEEETKEEPKPTEEAASEEAEPAEEEAKAEPKEASETEKE
ncbi:MAG: hypothetical protein COA78_19835 [Blastopirellula sp.]|nr:MAG: hypothetical protein COA78_19835 [Blastopirellula sp.]